MRILLYGATGWIGSKISTLLECIPATSRLDNYGSIGLELDRVQPTHVILCAGLTGRPNVDWCEDHKIEVIETNVIGTSVLASECHRRRIHLTYLGTGCIYEYDREHPIGGPGFKEEEEPNFDKSYYSKTKIIVEKILKEYDNVLILRLRMPLSDDLHPRNFITKITRYSKVVNVPNSMSILHDLLPLIPKMVRERITGTFNFVNPGVISHNRILDLYKSYIDPDFTYTNFSLEEQAKILKAGRSNNHLDASKLCRISPVPPIEESIVHLFGRMSESMKTLRESE
jgi:3,5-epimerase/4-reductase